ncbi:MAG: DUF934 domain-containing protein [Phyllobacterium sp.]
MTEIVSRLWSSEGFQDDPYLHADTLEEAGDAAAVIIPLAAWLALDEKTCWQTNRRIGVAVTTGESIEPLLAHLGNIPLIALHFPAFNDGRSYSKAELLRNRHGFGGELRAFGDVLIDQVAFMLRTGFDTLEVVHGVTLDRLGSKTLYDTPYYYQPGRGSKQQSGTFAWRRIPAN